MSLAIDEGSGFIVLRKQWRTMHFRPSDIVRVESWGTNGKKPKGWCEWCAAEVGLSSHNPQHGLQLNVQEWRSFQRIMGWQEDAAQMAALEESTRKHKEWYLSEGWSCDWE